MPDVNDQVPEPLSPGIISIQLARLDDWPDEEAAPKWVRMTIWAATARPDEFPPGAPACGLCQRPHTSPAPIAAVYHWPDDPVSLTALCAACDARYAMLELQGHLVDAIRQILPREPVALRWITPSSR